MIAAGCSLTVANAAGRPPSDHPFHSVWDPGPPQPWARVSMTCRQRIMRFPVPLLAPGSGMGCGAVVATETCGKGACISSDVATALPVGQRTGVPGLALGRCSGGSGAGSCSLSLPVAQRPGEGDGCAGAAAMASSGALHASAEPLTPQHLATCSVSV